MKKVKIEFNEEEIIKLENCIEHVEREAKRIKNLMNLNKDEDGTTYLDRYMRELNKLKAKIYKAKE